MNRTCSTNVEKRKAYRLLVRKAEGKRPLGRPKSRWVDDIKTDLGDIRWGGMDWIGLAQENVVKFLSSCTTGGLSGGAQCKCTDSENILFTLIKYE
jgi:hypothetical protein